MELLLAANGLKLIKGLQNNSYKISSKSCQTFSLRSKSRVLSAFQDMALNYQHMNLS